MTVAWSVSRERTSAVLLGSHSIGWPRRRPMYDLPCTRGHSIRSRPGGMQAWSLDLRLREPRNLAGRSVLWPRVVVHGLLGSDRFQIRSREAGPRAGSACPVARSARRQPQPPGPARLVCRGCAASIGATRTTSSSVGARGLCTRTRGSRWRKSLDRTQRMAHESTVVNATAPNDCVFAACDCIARSACALGRSAGSVLVLVVIGAGAAAV
jgi:hypothetical protein